MNITIRNHHLNSVVCAIAVVLVILLALFIGRSVSAESTSHSLGEHVLTVHDGDVTRGLYTSEKTLAAALEAAGVRIDPSDRTEPALDTELVTGSYEINIYRARPVIVRDGSSELRITTAYRTAPQIAKHAGIELAPEDKVRLMPASDILTDGAAEVMTIERSTEFTFEFYGKTETARTLADTVGDMLEAKGIEMGKNDRIEPAVGTPITSGMTVKLWREGKQTVTVDEDVQFEVEQIQDADRERGFKEVKTPGVNGKRTVTYEIVVKNGKEESRREINSIVTKQPEKQVEIVGTKRPPVAGPAEILDKIHATSAAKGIDGNRVAAIAKCESGFNPNADSGYYKGLFQHDPNYWPARAAKYGFSGASIYDVDAQIGVSTSMMAAGGWSHWGCKG